MATITKYKINGIGTEPFREAQDVTISADYGTETQPALSLDSITLVDSAGALNSKKLLDLWTNLPTEGAPFSIEITDSNISYDFDFYFDYTKMVFLSDVETQVGLLKDKSLTQFDFRAQGITQTLLNQKGFLGNNDYTPVPYIVENRKTILEKIQILATTFSTIKTIIDEIHKIYNLASDIPTGGALVALANVASSLAALAVLSVQLFNLLKQIGETFFPPVKYHSGLKPKTFIQKSIEYMGYDGVNYGTLTDIMERLTWIGSKNNEKGVPQYSLISIPNSILQSLSGLFKPADYGYFLIDAIDLLTSQFRLRRAIINNVLHLRPENDPFWATQSGYQLPPMKVEQIFANNGTIRPNYEDVQSSLIIEYSTDDSDLWTLEDLKDESNPNTTGKIISVKTVEPIVVNDQRKNLLRGSKIVNIPHCLASRKDVLDDLFDLFLGSATQFDDFEVQLEAIISSFASTLGAGAPAMATSSFLTSFGNRSGAMKVENDYFSIPKQMLLVDNNQGLTTIPETFADEIGAQALIENYHSWDSFIAGERNPNNPNETAGKFVYEEVKIPFGLQDFNTVLNNAFFTTQSGEVGKFEKIDWNVRGDYAIVTYWVYNSWLINIEENIT